MREKEKERESVCVSKKENEREIERICHLSGVMCVKNVTEGTKKKISCWTNWKKIDDNS